jgi:hypothetical protein
MKALGYAFLVLAAVTLMSGSASSGEYATPEEAKAMAIRAAEYLKAVGPDKAFAVFNDRDDAKFHDRDLYVFVNDSKGLSVAHGFQPEIVGTEELDIPDADGKYYMYDIVTIEDQGWVDYKWKSPMTGTVHDKTSYIVRVGDYLVGVGAYKY